MLDSDTNNLMWFGLDRQAAVSSLLIPEVQVVVQRSKATTRWSRRLPSPTQERYSAPSTRSNKQARLERLLDLPVAKAPSALAREDTPHEIGSTFWTWGSRGQGR